MKYRHILFDLDGTLIDTEQAVLQAWQRTLREYGYEFSLPQLREVYGLTNQSALARLHAVTDDQFDQNWIRRYDETEPGCTYFPGAEATLQQLRERGCRLGAVTSRNRAEYGRYFGRYGLERYMDAIILDEDTVRHKPEAEPILKYLSLSGACREECIYIGDMPTDVQCAQNAGIASAILSPQGILMEVHADYVLHSIREALQFADRQ